MPSSRSSDRELIADSKTALFFWNSWTVMAPIGRAFSLSLKKARKINTDAIADLAVENFVEMRDRVCRSAISVPQESRIGIGGEISAIVCA